MPDNQSEPTASVNAPFAEQSPKETLHVTCDRCGAIVSGRRGSITAWIFGSAECICKQPKPTTIESNVATNPACELADTKLASDAALPERYTVLSLIAEGGMGRVYRTFDKEAQTEVAVKVLREELLQDPDSVKRFMQEAKASSELKHPNIVNVKAHGMTSHSRPYIVMDYLKGYTLDQLLEREVYVDSNEAITIFEQVCQALKFAHKKGVVHRDIKPSNIMVMRESNTFVVKLIDFGIAKVRQSHNSETQYLTQTGEIFGSPVYMSPEQGLGEKLDASSDIYSLGCVMYETLTGSPPFADENPIKTVFHHLNSVPPPFANSKLEIPADFEKIVMLCLAKSPSNRYSSISKLLSDLEKLKAGKPVSISQIERHQFSRIDSAPVWLRVLASLISVAATASIAGSIYGWFCVEILQIASALGPEVTVNFLIAIALIGLCAPLGKAVCGLTITDEYGGRPNRIKLIVRYCLKAAFVPCFPLFVLFEFFRLIKQVVTEDAPVKVALANSFSKAPWDRLTGCTVRRRASVDKRAYWSAFALVVLVSLPIVSIRSFVSDLPFFKEVVQPAFPIQIELPTKSSREWMIFRLVDTSIFGSRLSESVVSSVAKDSKLVESRTWTLSAPGVYACPPLVVTEESDGSQSVLFDDTTVRRFPGAKKLVIESNGVPVVTCAFSDNAKGEPSGIASILYPDGTKGVLLLDDPRAIEPLRTLGNPIDLAWYQNDGKFGCLWYAPRAGLPYRVGLVEFLEQSRQRFRTANRCFLKADNHNVYGRLKWRNASDSLYSDYLTVYQFDKPIQKDVVVTPGKRYRLQVEVAPGRYTQLGKHDLEVLLDGRSYKFEIEHTKYNELQFSKPSLEFTALRPVVRIELLNPTAFGAKRYASIAVRDVRLTVLD